MQRRESCYSPFDETNAKIIAKRNSYFTSASDLAREFCVTRQYVENVFSYTRKYSAIYVRCKRRAPEAERKARDAKIIALRNEGKTFAEIVAALGVTPALVAIVIFRARKKGIAVLERRSAPDENDARVIEADRLWRLGKTAREITQATGLTAGTLRGVMENLRDYTEMFPHLPNRKKRRSRVPIAPAPRSKTGPRRDPRFPDHARRTQSTALGGLGHHGVRRGSLCD